jgi:phosphoglycerol transferase MdoB-like AlkP superfamily enzyme
VPSISTRSQRWQPLLGVGAVFLGLSTLTRASLLLATHDLASASVADAVYLFVVGFAYDLLALLYVATPLALWLWLAPGWLLRRPLGRLLHAGLCLAWLYVMVLVAVAEWTFWDEFQTRFNFIAVDYLVYTTEVLGNIRESYPLAPILAATGVVAVLLYWLSHRGWQPEQDHSRFAQRSAVAAVWVLALALAGLVSAEMKDRRANHYVNELAGNGIYQFFAAYRVGALDYPRFYRTLPVAEAFDELRRSLATPEARFVSTDPLDIARDIRNPAPERRLNVVLVSIESLSAWFSGTYGRPDSLTPELDALSNQSLLFTRLYASGTRTVRGMEALALSVPPTPGESIVRRPRNEGLSSLADVFNRKGYVSQFFYGGYGAFDNMNQFFGHNGYEVHDRTAIPSASIHHSNIWGVADEDLYSLALAEFDHIRASGRPFFAHLLTTSNHRPYTFPEGRIDRPQGERHSAVAYTDWAIGDFLRRARSRPWFDDTVFVITADHCASSGGIAKLPVFRYHIPLWIYSPKHIAPQRIDRLMAQIDIGPTLLGLLGMDYRSRFYGVDLFQLEPGRERALIGNYQRLGYLRNDQLIELAPHRHVGAVRPEYREDLPQPEIGLDPTLAREAIGYYQTASHRFSKGLMVAEPPIARTMGAATTTPSAAQEAPP